MGYSDYAEKIGFKKEKEVYVREHEGFYAYLKDWQYIILAIPSIYIPLDKPITKEEISKISKALFDTACAAYGIKEKGDTLIISLPEGKKDTEKFTSLAEHQVKEAIKILKEDGYGPMKNCPICGEEAPYMEFGDNYCPLHEECKAKYIAKIEEKVKEESSKKGLCVLSILASLGLALVGLAPALLLAIFNHDFFTGLVALVPILCTVGYFLVKAPASKVTNLITGLIPLVTIITFGVIMLPSMAAAKEMNFFNYCFTEGWVGFRKIIFMTILCFGGFGGVKFVSKFKVNYSKELEKLKK